MSARDDHDPRDEEVSRLRVPPNSAEAEQAVLGALLLDNAAWDRVGDLLAETDFYRHEHRLIFGTVSLLVTAMKPADPITVFEALERQGKAGDVGGLAYLTALTSSSFSLSSARRYAEIVREKSMARRVIALVDEAASDLFTGGSVTESIDKLATDLGALERSGMRKEPRLLAQILIQRLDRVNELHEGGIEPGMPTGIPGIDRRLNGGLRGGHVYVIAARPSVGKSSLAEAIGLSMARHQGLPVLLLSQEMPEGEVGDRAIAELGAVRYSAIQTGKLNDLEWGQLTQGVEIGSRIPFYVDDQPGLRLRDIRIKSRAVKGLKVLILDYLQLSEGEGRPESRAAEIGSISRGLKKLAKELDVAVIALSQLNRKVEERPGKRPIMPDLRDSGEIEQDADVIGFLWPVRDLEGGAKLIGFEFAKNRQGVRGEVALHFEAPYQRWMESTESLHPGTTGPTREHFE